LQTAADFRHKHCSVKTLCQFLKAMINSTPCRSLVFAILICRLAYFSVDAAATSPVSTNDPMAGMKLARELVELQPAEETFMSGLFTIKRRGQETVPMPVRIRVLPREDKWFAFYRLPAAPANRPNTYCITHFRNGTNLYSAGISGSDNAAALMEAVRSGTVSAASPLADTDFTLGDLGMEFLHWPEQRLLKTEMKRSRLCRVLESQAGTTGTPLGYTRVVSWIDNETGGIIQAEAFDAAGKTVKEFELNSFKKVAGRWQLEEMEIRNITAKSRTRLTFDLQNKPAP